MKKLSLALVGTLILVILLAACASSPTPTTQPQQAAQPFRVAVVMPSKINDLAFSQSMYDALVAIQNQIHRQHVCGRRCSSCHPRLCL